MNLVLVSLLISNCYSEFVLYGTISKASLEIAVSQQACMDGVSITLLVWYQVDL